MRKLSGAPKMEATRRYERVDDPRGGVLGEKGEAANAAGDALLRVTKYTERETISTVDKSDLADAMVMMCAKDIR